jgi:hypothetical protein
VIALFLSRLGLIEPHVREGVELLVDCSTFSISLGFWFYWLVHETFYFAGGPCMKRNKQPQYQDLLRGLRGCKYQLATHKLSKDTIYVV